MEFPPRAMPPTSHLTHGVPFLIDLCEHNKNCGNLHPKKKGVVMVICIYIYDYDYIMLYPHDDHISFWTVLKNGVDLLLVDETAAEAGDAGGHLPAGD